MKNKRSLFLCMVLLVSMLSGCAASTKEQGGQDAALPRKPERVVILNTEALELFYQLGGTAIGRASAPGTPVPEAARSVEEVGQINEVSMEKIASLKPDLVIGQPFFHAGLKDALAAVGVPLVLVQIESVEDIRKAAKQFGQLLGKEAEADKAIKDMDDRIDAIVSKLPDESPSYAALTIMPMGVSLQKSGSLAVDIADRLNMKNVAESMPSGQMPSSVPYSIEKLIEADPDYLFLIVHGTEEYGRKQLKEELEQNPAWASLRAVKEKRMVFLPADFVNVPGLHVDRAFAHLAKIVYPKAFGQ
ncbi:ABC transporter substrate-binding protein [Cohnella soli]|uniref:ABC transporter substrate-binding protein n=1 Tax=Cohnella soli TaxID=425005 RepID=A0ABW0HYJ0_9BACL